jgi:pilus assembly protein CpaB
MDVRKLMLLIGALVVAAVTAVTAKNLFSGASAPTAAAAPVPAGPEVLVAAKPLTVGTIIDAESFRYQRWPEAISQPAYYIKGQPGSNPQALIGSVVRNEISVGQPITAGSVIKPGERGFLAAALGPGMRAVTVPVSATSGVAGFVFPGDRVDVVLTQEVTGGGDGPPLRASETIVRNMRVLATDQRMNAKGEDGKPIVERISTVTLEATPKIAEKIAVAQTIGQISLSLRSISDNNAELQRAVASGSVKMPAGTDPKAQQQYLLEIAGRPVDTGTTYTVGADVSRFQRSTVPSKSHETTTGAAAAPAATATAAAAPAAAASPEAAIARGPHIRIARGNTVTLVPVGAK